MPLASPHALQRFGELTDGEQAALASYRHFREWESGYSKQQSTRPQTLGYGLVDSPAAQCAWIVENFWAWIDNDGHPRAPSRATSACTGRASPTSTTTRST